jgi:hypothetical protein
MKADKKMMLIHEIAIVKLISVSRDELNHLTSKVEEVRVDLHKNNGVTTSLPILTDNSPVK